MPRDGVLAHFYTPRGRGFELSFSLEVGKFPIKKVPGGFAEGG